jgi:molybdenum cofactor guanylyltransferase
MADLTLAVLAGGEGSRMGVPKSRLRIAGQPILAFLLDRLAWRGPTLLVTAPGFEKPPGAERFDREASDPVAGLGPLRGVLTAVENAQTDAVVIATIDMLCITKSQLQWVGERLGDRRGLMIVRGNQIEPFPSAWRSSAAPVIASQLAENRRAVHGLAKLDGFATIAPPGDWPDEAWTNLNIPEDLRGFERRLEKR